MILFIIIIIAVVLFYFLAKPYLKPHDTVELWVGTNGSGKTLNGVKSCLHAWKRNKIKVYFHNLFHLKNRKKTPIILSNIPIKYNGKIVSYELKAEHVLGIEKIPEKAIVFIDEVSLWLSQMDYKNPNIDKCDLVMTLYRHMTRGGYWVMTTQDINKCAFPYRYCVGSAFVLSDFKKPFWGFGLIGSSSVRRISINGDIQAVEINQKEENEDRLYVWLSKHYDTYAYSVVFDNVPYGEIKKHTSMKIDKVLSCPKQKLTNENKAKD